MPIPLVRYPAGPITPAGRCALRQGKLPMMDYTSPDSTVTFNLVGPLAIFDRTMPERVQIQKMKGLIPPWEAIEQKGATQDGSTFVTSLYDPVDVEFMFTAYGRDPSYCRKVLRHWVDSWDAKQTGQLAWTTRELGRWWADVRWARAPVDQLLGGLFNRQQFQWNAKAYDGFWRSYDSTDAFGLPYNSVHTDDFTTAYPFGLGPYWVISGVSEAAGYIYATGQAIASSLQAGATAVARSVYNTATSIQTATVTYGALVSNFVAGGFNDIWLRMNNTGAPGLDGLRLRIGGAIAAVPGAVLLTLSSFNNGVETVLRQVTAPPLQPGDQYSFTAGTLDNLGTMIVQVGNTAEQGWTTFSGQARQALLPVLTYVENNAALIWADAEHLAAGIGQSVLDALNQPAQILHWLLGEVSPTVTDHMHGFVTRVNAGDQNMWDRFTLIGPGTFGMGNGPNSTDMVYMGPLLDGQMVQVRCDPRKRGVVDMTSTPSTPAQQTAWQQAWTEFLTFVSNVSNWANPPAGSIFGVNAPQGNLYSLLEGRFSNPIPAKSPGKPAQPYEVAVSISGGGPSSAILVAGTPLRRFPQ